jgi:hypothetical protein
MRETKFSRMEFLKMMGVAAFATILTRLSHPIKQATALDSGPGSASIQQDYSYLVYKVGSTYKAKNGHTGLIEFENTNFRSLIESCSNSVRASGELIRIFPDSDGYTVDGPISFNCEHTRMNIQGVSKHGTNLIPNGNFPVFDFTDCSYFKLKNLTFLHRRADYDMTPFVKINDHCSTCDIEDCVFADGNGTYKGIGIGTYVQTDYAAIFLKIRDCLFDHIKISFYADSSESSVANPFVNGLLFANNIYNGIECVEKTNLKTGGDFEGNLRINEQLQSDSNFRVGFDWDDLGRHTLNSHQNVILWDINADNQYYAKLSPRDNLLLDGCTPIMNSKMSGSGWNNGARLLRRSTFTVDDGKATFSANGKTTDFKINHKLQYVPTKFSITPLSKDAAEAFYIFDQTSDYFILRYLRPPAPAIPAGSNNIILSWRVNV